jgi:hypothetical protein
VETVLAELHQQVGFGGGHCYTQHVRSQHEWHCLPG